MIYTFTPNPAVDYYIKVDDFSFNKINRIDRYSFVAAGKGINCSLMLDIMGINNVACFFSAGFTGRYIQESLNDRQHIKTIAFETDGMSRVNIKFIGEADTAINAIGPSISDKAKEELYSFIERCNENDYFIISGSLPRDFNKEDLLRVCRKINERKAKLIIDIPDISLDDLRNINVYLIKPNLEELSDLFNIEIDLNNYRDYLNELADLGVENILLSLADKGSYYLGQYGRYKIDVPKVDTYSPVGAGDSMLAGFIVSESENKNIEDILRFANACGVAKVRYEHLDSLDKIDEFINNIVVTKE